MNFSLVAPARVAADGAQVPPCTFFAARPLCCRLRLEVPPGPLTQFGATTPSITPSLYAQHSAKVAAVFTIVAFAAVLGLAIHAVANISHKVLQG